MYMYNMAENVYIHMVLAENVDSAPGVVPVDTGLTYLN